MTPTEIIIHHAGELDLAEFNWAGIRRYHMTPEAQGGPKGGPWLAEGYHAGVEFVKDDYFAVFGRPWHWPGAHCVGHNDRALGLCFVGNFNLLVPADKMLATGANVVRTWLRLYGLPGTAIHKHSEFNATDCPGKLFPWERFLKLCGA